MVSGSISLPSPGFFSFFGRPTWCAIGHRVMLSLGRWSSRIHAGFHVSGATWVARPEGPSLSRTGLSPSAARAFLRASASSGLCNFRRGIRPADARSLYPECATRGRLTRIRFGLVPFRSPLLGKSLLLSFPGGTKMFQFSPFASPPYGFGRRCQGFSLAGCPIRTSADPRSLTAPRGFSQSSTSFVASRCLNIRHAPLVSCHLTSPLFLPAFDPDCQRTS